MPPKRTTLYHVTLTSNVAKIKKRGLLLMQKTNWVKAGSGARYGGGEIFAFEDIADAIRWTTKVDWSLHKEWGTGKVSIVVFETDLANWEEDDADPFGRSSQTGRWLKSHAAVRPAQILRADPVTMDAIRNLIG